MNPIWVLVLLFYTAHLGSHIGPPIPRFYLTSKECEKSRITYIDDAKKAGWGLKCVELVRAK